MEDEYPYSDGFGDGEDDPGTSWWHGVWWKRGWKFDGEKCTTDDLRDALASALLAAGRIKGGHRRYEGQIAPSPILLAGKTFFYHSHL